MAASSCLRNRQESRDPSQVRDHVSHEFDSHSDQQASLLAGHTCGACRSPGTSIQRRAEDRPHPVTLQAEDNHRAKFLTMKSALYGSSEQAVYVANCKGAGEMARLVKGLKLKHEDLVQRPSTHVQSQTQEQMSVTPLPLEDLIPSIPAHLCEAVPFPLRTHSKSHYEMPCVTAVMLCVLEQQRGPRPTAGVRVTPGSTAPRLENGKPLSISSSYNVSVTKCFRRVQTQD